jgi:hypothetical protein
MLSAICLKEHRKKILMETNPVPFSARPHLCSFLVLGLLYAVVVASPASASLFFNFYGASCPTAELIVSNTVRSASSSDPTIPGKLLRLVFHDCFVEVSLFHLLCVCVSLMTRHFTNFFLHGEEYMIKFRLQALFHQLFN